MGKSYRFNPTIKYKGITYANKLDLTWAKFFENLDWGCTYKKNNVFKFDIKIDNIKLKVMVVDTDNFKRLTEIQSKLTTNHQLPYLIVGYKLFDFYDMDYQPNFQKIISNIDTFEQIHIIGLICYKMNGKHRSMVILCKDHNGKYSLCFYCDKYGWILDLNTSTEDDGKSYNMSCKSLLYENMQKINNINEIDTMWHFAEKDTH